MSTLDARHLDADPEGTERLLAVLHATSQSRGRALVRGRRRAARAASIWGVPQPARSAAGELEVSPG